MSHSIYTEGTDTMNSKPWYRQSWMFSSINTIFIYDIRPKMINKNLVGNRHWGTSGLFCVGYSCASQKRKTCEIWSKSLKANKQVGLQA